MPKGREWDQVPSSCPWVVPNRVPCAYPGNQNIQIHSIGRGDARIPSLALRLSVLVSIRTVYSRPTRAFARRFNIGTGLCFTAMPQRQMALPRCLGDKCCADPVSWREDALPNRRPPNGRSCLVTVSLSSWPGQAASSPACFRRVGFRRFQCCGGVAADGYPATGLLAPEPVCGRNVGVGCQNSIRIYGAHTVSRRCA